MKQSKIIAIVLALACVSIMLLSCQKQEELPADDAPRITQFGSFPFYEADFEENIYEDADYMNKERAMRYTSDSGMSVLISDEKYSDYGDGDDTLFFAKYFKSIIDGDAEKYRAFHTARFLGDMSKEFDFRTSEDALFTPQKLYNIEVEKIGSAKEADVLYRYYIVRYLIHKNNGTFRNDDMLDRSYTPLVITLVTPDKGESLIDSVEFYNPEKGWNGIK